MGLEHTYHLDASGKHTGLTDKQVHDLFRRALRKWSQVSPLTFRPEGDPQKADIRARFGPIDGSGETAAHWDRNARTIVFDSAESWMAPPTSSSGGIMPSDHLGFLRPWLLKIVRGTKLDFLSVAVHEIGHALTLEHIDDPNSVMRRSLDRGEVVISTGRPLHQVDIDRLFDRYRDDIQAYFRKNNIIHWRKRESGAEQIVIAGDQSIWCIGQSGYIYRLDNQYDIARNSWWRPVSDVRSEWHKYREISSYNEYLVMAIGRDNFLYKLESEEDRTWRLLVQGHVCSIALGGTASVYRLMHGNQLFRFHGDPYTMTGNWQPVRHNWEVERASRNSELARIVVGSDPAGKDELWALSSDQNVYQLDQRKGWWLNRTGPGQYSSIDVGQDGTVLACDNAGNVYEFARDATDRQTMWKLWKDATFSQISVTTKEMVIGLRGHDLYSSVPSAPD